MRACMRPVVPSLQHLCVPMDATITSVFGSHADTRRAACRATTRVPRGQRASGTVGPRQWARHSGEEARGGGTREGGGVAHRSVDLAVQRLVVARSALPGSPARTGTHPHTVARFAPLDKRGGPLSGSLLPRMQIF